MLAAALTYFESGWPVFPVCSPAGPGHCFEHPPGKHAPDAIGKHPLVRWSLFQDQLPTVDNLRDWWRRWPRANIGLATGALSGIALIDLDGFAARQDAERRGLEPGPTVATGRVGGQHRYCAWRSDAPTVFARNTGIDLRAQGGYALLPPSRHRNGPRYTWLLTPEQASLPPLPRWIDELAHEGRQRGSECVTDDIPEHERNVMLTSMAGSMRRRGFGEKAILAALLVENAERCRPPLDDKEVATIVTSVSRYAPSWSAPRPAHNLTTPDAGRLPPLQRPAGVRVPPLVDPRWHTQRLGNFPEADVHTAA
jgi:Bifunctional DNA primase/polymerase, N-terminal/Primase C terminal 1 (PriCT-1)